MSKQKQKTKGKTKIKPTKQEMEIKPSTSSKQILWPILIITALAFVLYGNTIGHDYALDDAIAITSNNYVKKGTDGIKDIFTNDAFTGFFGTKKNLVSGGRYRPLSFATFAIEYKLFKFNPQISHFINILLYALTCIFLFLIFQKLFPEKKWFFAIPFIAVLLYLSHPIHTEVVANIKGRDEIMALLFSLLCFWLILIGLQKKKYLWHILAGAAFFLAILSKENAVAFIFIIPLAIAFFTNNLQHLKHIDYILPFVHKFRGFKAFSFMLPVIISFSLFLFLRNNALEGITKVEVIKELMNNPFLNVETDENYKLIEILPTIFHTMFLYVKLLFVPHPLTYDYYPYHIKIMNWGIPSILSFVLFLFMAGYGIYHMYLKKGNPFIAFGFLFYLASIALFTNILFPVGTFMNERFVFMASIGFCLIVGWFLVHYLPGKMKNSEKARIPILVITAIIIGLYSFKTIDRNKAWKNDYTLFITDVETSKDGAKSNCSAGGKLVEEAQKLKKIAREGTSIKAMQRQIEKTNLSKKEKEKLFSTNNEEDLKSALNKKAEGMVDKAIGYLEHAIEIHPKYKDAMLLLGNAYFEKDKQIEKSLHYYTKILKMNPTHKDAFNNALLVMNIMDEPEVEFPVYQNLLKIKPNNYEINYNLGVLYGKYKNDLKQAIKLLEKAVEIDPKRIDAYKDLGVAYGIAGMHQESLKNFEIAIQMEPNDPLIYNNMANTYAAMNNVNETIRLRNKAKEIQAKNQKTQ